MLLRFMQRFPLYSCVLALLLLALCMYFFLPKTGAITARGFPIGATENIKLLPDLQKHINSYYIYSIPLKYEPHQTTGFQLYPTSCIKSVRINGVELMGEIRFPCSTDSGAYINLAERLQQGDNMLEVMTEDGGLHIGTVIFRGMPDTVPEFIGLLMLAVSCYAFMLIIQRHTGEWASGAIAAAGLCFYTYWLSVTGALQYSQDMGGHMNYITMIARNLSIPKPLQCWSCFHPPLYYAIEGMIIRLANIISGFDAMSCIRLFSLGCYMTFISFSIFTLRRLVKTPLAYYSALVLLVCYPSGIFTSARIDSNTMFHAVFAMCAYFMLRWLESNKLKHLAITIALTGLGLATRTNAVVLVLMLGIAVLYQLYKKKVDLRQILSSGLIWACVALFIAGGLSNYGRNLYYKLADDSNESLLVSNADYLKKFERFHILNSPTKLLVPHFPGYIEKPFHPAFNNYPSRDYFWNAMLKTSLFGEFVWPKPFVAQLLSLLLLGLVIYAVNGVILGWGTLTSQSSWWVCSVPLCLLIALLAALRLINPLFSSHDFRYIYPAVAIFAAMVGLIIENHMAYNRPVFAYVGVVLIAAFSVCSLVFFL